MRYLLAYIVERFSDVWVMPRDRTSPEKVILAKPRGFCAGVDRAIDVVNLALELYQPPVYVRKQIVHNRYVIERLSERGAVFVDEVDEVPEGALLIVSAHGVSPEIFQKARQISFVFLEESFARGRS